MEQNQLSACSESMGVQPALYKGLVVTVRDYRMQ